MIWVCEPWNKIILILISWEAGFPADWVVDSVMILFLFPTFALLTSVAWSSFLISSFISFFIYKILLEWISLGKTDHSNIQNFRIMPNIKDVLKNIIMFKNKFLTIWASIHCHIMNKILFGGLKKILLLGSRYRGQSWRKTKNLALGGGKGAINTVTV